MRFPTPIRNNPSGIERKSMRHEKVNGPQCTGEIRENPAKSKHGANTLGPSYLQGHPLGRFGSIEVAKRPKKVRIEYQGVDSRTSFESTQIVQSKCTAPLVHLLLGLAMQQTPELGSSKGAAKV
jgi:hypothetical protein